MINIYTDGSATKSRSGWGWIAVYPEGQQEHEAGTSIGATNQRMELMAALRALIWWKREGHCRWDSDDDVTIHTDSAYLYNCWADKWWVKWENNGWRNSQDAPVANMDLWKYLTTFFKDPQVSFAKVKGHSGHVYNEMADKLATGAIKAEEEQWLKIQEKNDKINIELSEILLDYSLKKYPVDETIKRIRKACGCE